MKNICCNGQNFYYIVGNETNTSDKSQETGRLVLKIYEYPLSGENANIQKDDLIFSTVLNQHYHCVYIRESKVVICSGKHIYFIQINEDKE